MSSKTKKILKKVWNITFTVIVVLVVACAIFLVGSRIAGFKVFNILSPSMEPKYSVGDLVYVKAIENGNIKGIEVGDDITFVVGEDLTVGTHRVIAIDEEKQQITTKGLANETEDPPVHFKNVIGEVKFAIPLMGYVSHFIQNPPGNLHHSGAGCHLHPAGLPARHHRGRKKAGEEGRARGGERKRERPRPHPLGTA